MDNGNYHWLLASVFEALVLSTALPHAGNWLKIIPFCSLGLHLKDREFKLCLDYWLGLQMTKEGPHLTLSVERMVIRSISMTSFRMHSFR